MPDQDSNTRHGVRHVDVGDSIGQRVDNFLVRMLPGVPKSRVYRMLRRGEVRINGQRVGPDYRLVAGDRIRLPPWHGQQRDQPALPAHLLRTLETAIMYRDDSIIVLDKPSGLPVHGGSGVSMGAIEALRLMFPGGRRLELAHRIDRDTSGLLLVARGRAMLVELHAAFRDGRVSKTYDALVHGRWPRRTRSVQSPLTRYVTPGGERRVRVDADAGKSARTDFQVVEALDSASWIRAFPHTGRTHQIRVHCRQAAHPIVGDEKYSSDAQLDIAHRAGVRRLCLHATSLSVTLGGHLRRFEAPIPDDFRTAWEGLRSVAASPADAER